jgi:hypothetical protein
MLLKRIRAGAYQRGDLISLAGELGDETFDYPYFLVKKDFVAINYGNTNIPNQPAADCVELIYPAWNEKMAYYWNSVGETNRYKYIEFGYIWKVWYKNILYEWTKWVKPTDVGVPPNEQVTNAGDNAGVQNNLKGELRIFASWQEEQDHPYPAFGHPSVLKNDSHTFRSWIISEAGQLNNPYWEYSSNLTYLVYNNYIGDDTPDSVSTWNWHYEQFDGRPQYGDYTGGLDQNPPYPAWVAPPVEPLRNRFVNSFSYQPNPSFYGFTVVKNGDVLDSDGYLPDDFDSSLQREVWQISGEGSQRKWYEWHISQTLPPLNLEYWGWETYGMNPLTGLMPQKDTRLCNQYLPAYGYYAQGSVSMGFYNFQSIHLFREGLQNRPIRKRFDPEQPYRDYISANLKVIDPAYPPDDQLHISVVQDFEGSLSNQKTPYNKGIESVIQRDGKIYVRTRDDRQVSVNEGGLGSDSGGYLYNNTPLGNVGIGDDGTSEQDYTGSSTDTGVDEDGIPISPTPPVRVTTSTSQSIRKDGWYYFVTQNHPLVFLRKVSVLEYGGETTKIENISKSWTYTLYDSETTSNEECPTYTRYYCGIHSTYIYNENRQEKSSAWKDLRIPSVDDTIEKNNQAIGYPLQQNLIRFAIGKGNYLMEGSSYTQSTTYYYEPPDCSDLPCGKIWGSSFGNSEVNKDGHQSSYEDYRFEF